MKWLVCKTKDTGELFITNRGARESMINVLQDLGQQPDSIVLKVCQDYQEADDYKRKIEQADRDIKNSLKK